MAKGFAVGSAALTALALFSAYRVAVGLEKIDLLNPTVLVGLLLGYMLPFLFSSFAMDAVGRAAFSMIEEVRRQFKTIPGLMEGTGTADFRKCVDISTAAAIREMVAPGLLAVLTPVVVGFGSKQIFSNVNALGGLLAAAFYYFPKLLRTELALVAKQLARRGITLDRARLEALDARKAQLVKLRYFAGMTNREAAEAMGISATTADRYWSYARAWLQREMGGSFTRGGG